MIQKNEEPSTNNAYILMLSANFIHNLGKIRYDFPSFLGGFPTSQF